MTSLVNKAGDWTPNYHKILIFSPPKSLKSLRTTRKDELADSKESAKNGLNESLWCLSTHYIKMRQKDQSCR